MITLTKEWLLKTIAELEEERNATPGAVNEDAANALAAMKLALASLEAEPVGTFRNGPCGYSPSFHEDAVPLYTAPPATVSVPDAYIRDERGRMMLNGRQEPRIGYSAGWNACRAAMLQGAEPVTTAYKLRDAVETIRNSGIEIDAEKIFAERDALNSPAIPDGWVTVPEEPTHEMLEAGDEQFGTYDVYRRMIAAAPQQEVRP